MTIIIDFLKDGAKIVFGSAVVGFFVPSLAGQVTPTIFALGAVATVLLLGSAVLLSSRLSNKV